MAYKTLASAEKDGWLLFEGGAEKALQIGNLFPKYHHIYEADEEKLLAEINKLQGRVTEGDESGE